MGWNSSGSGRERKTLDYYEKLPPIVRRALQDARYDWSTRWALKLWNKGNVSPAELVRQIKKYDLDHARKEARKVWGSDYPFSVI